MVNVISLNDLLNIDNEYFKQIVATIYPKDIQLNKTNNSYTEEPFLDSYISISYGIISTKIY